MSVIRIHTARISIVIGLLLLGCRSEPMSPDGLLPATTNRPGSPGHPGFGVDNALLDGVPFAVAINERKAYYVSQLIAGAVARGTLPSQDLSQRLQIGSITSQVRMSPDGRTAYANNQDEGTIKVIDVMSNTIIATIQGAPSILSSGIAPNGKTLYALSDFHGIDIIDIKNPRTATITGNIPQSATGSILAGIAFHPSQPRMYVSARDDGRINVINTTTNTVVSTVFVAGARIQNLAVSSDGSQLFATDIERSKLLVWSIAHLDAAPQEVAIGSPVSRNAFDVALTPDQAQVYVSTLADGNVYVVNRATLSPVVTLSVGASPRYIAFDKAGEFAVIPNEGGWVSFVHEGGAPPPPPPPPPPPSPCTTPATGPAPSGLTHPALGAFETSPLGGLPFAVAVSRNNVAYITQLLNATAVRADLPSSALSASFAVGGIPSQVRMSPDGSTAYVENQDSQTITYIDVATNTIIGTASIPGGSILQLGLSPDGTKLYALTDFSGVYVIDVSSRAVIAQVPASSTGSLLTGVAFHPFAACMYISARDEGVVRTVDLTSNAVVAARAVAGGRIQTLAVSRDGGTLYGGDIGRSKLISWDLPSASASFTETNVGTPVDRNLFDVEVTPDNAQLWVGTLSDGKVFVFDRATRTALGEIATGGSVRYIQFSPAGSQAVIANESGWVNFVP